MIILECRDFIYTIQKQQLKGHLKNKINKERKQKQTLRYRDQPDN